MNAEHNIKFTYAEKMDSLNLLDFSLILNHEQNGFTLSTFELISWITLHNHKKFTPTQKTFTVLLIFHFNLIELFDNHSNFHLPWAFPNLMQTCLKTPIIAEFIKHNDDSSIYCLFKFLTQHSKVFNFRTHFAEDFNVLFSILPTLNVEQQQRFQYFSLVYCVDYLNQIIEFGSHDLTLSRFKELFSVLCLYNYYHPLEHKNVYIDFFAEPENIYFAELLYDSIIKNILFRHTLYCNVTQSKLSTLFKLPTFNSLAFRDGNEKLLKYCPTEINRQKFPELFV